MNSLESTRTQVFAVFPGQGSQHVGMAKDLYDNFSLVKDVFEEASEAIHIDLKKLCFDGTEADLLLTENTQPCLLVSSIAAFKVAQNETGFRPDAVAGHSLGEYSALVAAESIDLASATRWVRERGIAMQRAVPAGEGTMAAILGLEDSEVDELCKQATLSAQEKRKTQENSISIPALVEPANFNAPSQVVIAGSTDAVQEAIELLKANEKWSRGKAIPLQVSAPFHCQLMKAPRSRMVELFSLASAAQRPRTPFCPYVPNRTGRLSREASLVFELLADQVDHAVLWKQSVSTLLAADYLTAFEFGPGKVLSGLIKRIASQEGKKCVPTSVNDVASVKGLAKFLETQK